MRSEVDVRWIHDPEQIPRWVYPSLEGVFLKRFWARVDVRSPDECWPWKGAKNARGYGVYAGRIIASRFSWEIHHERQVPVGMMICHHCDNPPCVNPAHLFLGTAADNTRDMDAKGRRRTVSLRGEQRRQARLTELQVLAIFALIIAGISQRQIAARFCVSPSAVAAIALGKSWAWLWIETPTPPVCQ